MLFQKYEGKLGAPMNLPTQSAVSFSALIHQKCGHTSHCSSTPADSCPQLGRAISCLHSPRLPEVWGHGQAPPQLRVSPPCSTAPCPWAESSGQGCTCCNSPAGDDSVSLLPSCGHATAWYFTTNPQIFIRRLFAFVA